MRVPSFRRHSCQWRRWRAVGRRAVPAEPHRWSLNETAPRRTTSGQRSRCPRVFLGRVAAAPSTGTQLRYCGRTAWLSRRTPRFYRDLDAQKCGKIVTDACQCIIVVISVTGRIVGVVSTAGLCVYCAWTGLYVPDNLQVSIFSTKIKMEAVEPRALGASPFWFFLYNVVCRWSWWTVGRFPCVYSYFCALWSRLYVVTFHFPTRFRYIFPKRDWNFQVGGNVIGDYFIKIYFMISF